jgi:hypothetical protein
MSTTTSSTAFCFSVRLVILLIFAVLVLAGCDGLLPAPAATQDPASQEEEMPPSVEAETEPDTNPTLEPTATAALLPTSEGSSSAAGDSLAGTSETGVDPPGEVAEVEFGTAAINILRPGQLSQLSSPFELRANLQTGDDLMVMITLYGEDGRVLHSKTQNAKPYEDTFYGNLITEIDFTLPIQAEAGRLELKVLDQFGRLKALNSVNLILLASPPSDRNYAPESTDRILLQLPFPAQTEISGSPLLVSGLVQTRSDHPLEIWLEDEQGNRVGAGAASVVGNTDSEYSQFIGEIDYQVSEKTPVLLIMAISDSRIRGYTYVKSVELNLYP